MNFITESLSSRDIAMEKLKFEVFGKFKFLADSKNLKSAESSRLLISQKIFVESRKRYFVKNLKTDREFKVLKAALIFIFVCAHHRWFEVKSFQWIFQEGSLKERLEVAWSWKYVFNSILLTLNKHKKMSFYHCSRIHKGWAVKYYFKKWFHEAAFWVVSIKKYNRLCYFSL